MKRADRQSKPARPWVDSTRDNGRISALPLLATVVRAIGSPSPQSTLDRWPGPELMGHMVSAAIELTLMFPRPILERYIERLIERLDEIDGDPDMEPIDEREPDHCM